MNIELEIDELVLGGVARGNAVAVGDALREELVRLLSERGAPRSIERDTEIGELRGPAIRLRGEASAQAVGRQLAAAVYESLVTK
jgi:hypothetical protein